MNDIKAYMQSINKTFSELQNGRKERVTAEEAVTAYAVLYNIEYDSLQACFLGCACINLLNTFVKQKPSPIGYGFKEELQRIICAVDEHNIQGITFWYEGSGRGNYSGLNSIGVCFCDSVRFSFHCMEYNASLDKLLKEQSGQPGFDGIRKQMCASTVLCTAFEQPGAEGFSCITGAPLSAKIDEELRAYRSGSSVLCRSGLRRAA